MIAINEALGYAASGQFRSAELPVAALAGAQPQLSTIVRTAGGTGGRHPGRNCQS
jgi:hypothetical protein